MWMMGYNDGGGELNMPDSCSGRRLRPLIPRPLPSSTQNTTTTTTTPPCSMSPCLGRLNGNDFFALNHHLASMADQNKKELMINTQPVVVSSRWNPTPEQLRTLEELYLRGTRTPTADQIQQITAQLRRYGKIEGKNVFYWFQNHKARERQKRRRQMESSACLDDQQHCRDIEIFERKESGASRTGYEGEQTKNNWAPSTNCSTLSEESGSIQRATKAVVAECRDAVDGWMQFDQGELHTRSFMERNATWQMRQLSCPSPTHHLIINSTTNNNNITSTTTTTTTTTSVSTTTVPTTTTTANTTAMRKNILRNQTILSKSSSTYPHHDHLNIFLKPYLENGHCHLFNAGDEEDCCGGESQTLQLFPLRSCDGNTNNSDSIISEKLETEILSVTHAEMNAHFTAPYQFFEFLPLKN